MRSLWGGGNNGNPPGALRENDLNYNTNISKLHVKLAIGNSRKIIMKGSTMEPKGSQMVSKWNKRVPNDDQNCTETDPKRSQDVKLASPCKITILGSFLDAFRDCPRFHFGAKICQSSMEKLWKNQSKKWCWKSCDFYSKVIRNWCQNRSKMPNTSELAISLFLQRV